MKARSAVLALSLLSACGEPLPAPVASDASAARSGVLLSISTSLESGETARYLVTGAAAGETVQLIRGRSVGAGPCPAKLGGLCLGVTGPVQLLGSAVADARGVATVALKVPNMPPGTVLATQAVIARKAGSVASNARADAVNAPITRTASTAGGALVVTEDGRFAVAANRTAGEITVLDLDVAAGTGTTVATFDVSGEEPWAAVLSSDGDTAYVVLKASAQVARITGVRSGAPVLDLERADVDAEPSGIAISPSGASLYVTNAAAGTVSVVDAQSLAVAATVDLNAVLLGTGVLGSSVASSRPGLAHPYAVVVTDDGDDDDDDETVYVTELFSQDDPAKSLAALGDAYFDTGRQGLVYAFATSTLKAKPTIHLGAVEDTGFADALGDPTGCFPNQLRAAALDNGRLYVTAMCASPRGPTFAAAGGSAKTNLHPTLFVVDTATNTERTSDRVVLTRAFEDEYVARGTPDDASRRFPLLPSDLRFGAGHVAYLSAYGADAVFRVQFAADGSVQSLGTPSRAFVDLFGAWPMGELPIGIAVASADRLVVLNENTRNLSIVDLGSQTQLAALPAASEIDRADLDAINLNRGLRAFGTGLDRWSLKGQAWGACASCHPDGGSDGVTWFFETGPKQTMPLYGSIGPAGEHRILTWTGRFDEVSDEEHNARDISGGVGATVWTAAIPPTDSMRISYDGTAVPGSASTTDSQVNLLGSMDEVVATGVPGTTQLGAAGTVKSASLEWQYVEDFVAALRSPSAPQQDPADVAAGADLFVASGCGGCHGGPLWTIGERFYTPGKLVSGPTGPLASATYDLGGLDPSLNPAAAAGPAPVRGDDNLLCALRAVGTYPSAGDMGVTLGATVREVREDMVTPADGDLGYVPPSLLGLASSAPYLHAGNARTLEEVLDPAFGAHTGAFAPGLAFDATERRQLVAFLLSIDDATAAVASDFAGQDVVICPDAL